MKKRRFYKERNIAKMSNSDLKDFMSYQSCAECLRILLKMYTVKVHTLHLLVSLVSPFTDRSDVNLSIFEALNSVCVCKRKIVFAFSLQKRRPKQNQLYNVWVHNQLTSLSCTLQSHSLCSVSKKAYMRAMLDPTRMMTSLGLK